MRLFRNAFHPSSERASQPQGERRGSIWRPALLFRLVALVCGSVLSLQLFTAAHVYAGSSSGTVFASTTSTPLLQYPEGITSWNGVVYTATYNVVNPSDSRIFAYSASTGQLLNTIGGNSGQSLVSAGALLGLTINTSTGDLYAAANFTGQILRIHNPTSPNAQVSVYATVPSGGGPEDLVFYKDGTLLSSDSNLGVIYAIPPGGGKVITLIGPPSSGALNSDNGLFFSGNSCTGSVAGLSPNGIVFSKNWKTLYVANTWANSIIAFDVTNVTNMSNPHIFAQNINYDLEEYPTGFKALLYRPAQKPSCSSTAPYGTSAASTPLNGPDGLALDTNGNIWVASNLGDNLTVLDPNGNVVTTYGTSEVTQNGLLNQPSGMTFVGTTVYCSNLGIFTGLAGTISTFTLVAFNVGVNGAGGNGNY
jgi:SMP-30/Gluconolactonase/LRE-like region